MAHWRAVCGESRKHGSEGGGWKRTVLMQYLAGRLPYAHVLEGRRREVVPVPLPQLPPVVDRGHEAHHRGRRRRLAVRQRKQRLPRNTRKTRIRTEEERAEKRGAGGRDWSHRPPSASGSDPCYPCYPW